VSPVPPLSAVLRRHYDFPPAHLRSLMDSLPQPTRSSCFRVRRSAPARLEVPSRPGLWEPAARLSGFSRVDANGISQVSRRSFPCLCCAPRPRSNRRTLTISVTSMLPPLPAPRRLRRLLISGLTHAASAPADLRFAFRVATHAQGSLPAGWLAFAGRASNPLDRYERFQLVFTFIPLPCPPDASGFETRPYKSHDQDPPTPAAFCIGSAAVTPGDDTNENRFSETQQ